MRREASGAAGIEEFTKAAKANDLTILDTVDYQTRTTDFAPIVAKIRSSWTTPDVRCCPCGHSGGTRLASNSAPYLRCSKGLLKVGLSQLER